ncbi:NACHT and WD repeat domain-containing protein 2-like [Mytilus californianus]|uniref:NACHT and WD repeat domain-containing protein 2-like n=1 Tax=Mytilus californianus TaxID=6549 RepID=UPI00224761B3|nr:NACHT and WD repeat domain-containing protein 2-like [Mytilus californianus]
MTQEIYHQEVTEKLPLDLNFMLLFSPSCGKPSLPRHIPEKEFELIQDKFESCKCKQLLSKWYIKDENSVPPKYILQPIATHLSEVLSQDGSKKMAATQQWKKESESLLEELLSAAEKALSQEEANRLKLSDSFRNEKLKTSITDLLKDLTTELAKQLPAGNILSYDTTKHEKGVNPANKVQMVDKMVKGVERKLKQMINEAIKKRQLYSIKSPLYDESLQHLLYCQSKYKNFQGNEDVIERMRKYVLDTSKNKFKYRIIHGASGSGKTFVMSMIAAKASEWWTKKKRGNIPVIMRFVRLTPGSSNLLDLLQSIIDQIRTIDDREQQVPPKGFKEIIADFEHTLNSTTKTMVILIDGVDQLDPGFNLTKSKFWIPQSIRSNVRFILSTTDNPDNEFFSILKEKLPEKCFIPVISTKTDLTSILNHSLMKNERKLTTSQQDLLMNPFNDGCVPLHLNLCISEALKWTSYMDMSNIQIKETIRDAIHCLFDKLEVSHGQIFTSRALGYLTASKKGLSQAELEDILSCDYAVLNEVFVEKNLAVQRFPSLLLIRLLCEMEQFTVVREVEGAMVTTWCNKMVKDMAEERYCSDQTSLHASLSDYFSGTMAYDHKKPFVNRNDGKEPTDRYVASQPIKYGSTYNGRKLGNLPYHLIMNGNISCLKEECLLNVEFLTSKLDYSSFRSVQEDFELARRQTDDRQIDLVFEALLLSQKALEINPKLFVQQMYLRLADVKVSPG